jgi:methylmalonyl-CoA epimerase
MIGRLNHVAIAVRDIAKAANVYRQTLGAQVSEPMPQPDHGVTTVFITLPNTKIELLEPLGPESPIAKFLDRNPDGGIHHVCYEVDDILAARAGRRECQDGRTRQAGAVPASQGFLRHAGRDRAGVNCPATAAALSRGKRGVHAGRREAPLLAASTRNQS